jgi:hypothetical protein
MISFDKLFELFLIIFIVPLIAGVIKSYHIKLIIFNGGLALLIQPVAKPIIWVMVAKSGVIDIPP